MGGALQFLLRQGGLPTAAYPALGALPGAASLCRVGRGIGVGHDPRPEARTGPAAAGSPDDRPPHPPTVAPMVAGPLRRGFVLERGSRPLHAAVVPKDDALVFVRQLWNRTARPPFGVAQVPGSDHDPTLVLPAFHATSKDPGRKPQRNQP